MLYLISGPSRSGKTLLAKTILKETQIPYLSLDWLMMGFNDGIPEYGIHHLLMPDELASRMWAFLQGMIDNILFEGHDYVIEGEAMLPELVNTLIKKYPGKVRAVFIGYSEVDVDDKMAIIKKYSTGENDWLTKESDEYIRDHINNMQRHGRVIKEECVKSDLPYFDTSADFTETIELAKDYLLKA
ncbi:MAG: hypothetical protein JJ971_04490 [Balneolaceae bacterium]|nr:hypothetical protein [Balneolaceae bacterium]MBO6545633.1 hypothetical protein [Balneolaceae bacterium]MBO6647029.1 hypothetical protein [Balneolaceae bacterium]